MTQDITAAVSRVKCPRYLRISSGPCPGYKCLQYHPMPQTYVWTVIGYQNPTYEPYGYGVQKVQKRAKNTSNLHRSSHSYARSIIVYVVLIIQMHTIPTQAPNMCADGDR